MTQNLIQTKQIIDAYVLNTGDTMTGDLVMDSSKIDVNSATPTINLENTIATGAPTLNFRNSSGIIRAQVVYFETGNVLSVRRNDPTGTFAEAEMRLLAPLPGSPGESIADFTVKARTPSTIDSDSGSTLVTKDYIDALEINDLLDVDTFGSGSPIGPTNGDSINYVNGTWVTYPRYGKNSLINGNFDIWQRGTTFGGSPGISTDQYTADRWNLDTANIGDTYTITRGALLPDEIPGSNFYCSITRTNVTAAVNSNIQQRIENVRTFAGEDITISFYARYVTSPPTGGFQIGYLQNFGSGGGSPSVSPSVSGAAFKTLTTVFQKFTHTFSLPSISGKIVGSNSYLEIFFNFVSASGTFGVDITQVQVEAGNVVTNFEYRSIGEELALCQRYYTKTYDTDTEPGSITNSGLHSGRVDDTFLSYVSEWKFPSSMRTTPTITFYNPDTGTTGEGFDFNGPILTGSPVTSNIIVTTQFVGETSITPILNATGGHHVGVHITADAEL